MTSPKKISIKSPQKKPMTKPVFSPRIKPKDAVSIINRFGTMPPNATA